MREPKTGNRIVTDFYRLIASLSMGCLFLLLLFSSIYGQSADAEKTDNGKLHGGIEISPEGIKAAAIRISDAEQGSGVNIVYSGVVTLALKRAQNGKFPPDVLKASNQAVQEHYMRMRQQYHIPPEHIYIISSCNFKSDNLDELVSEVRDKTGKSVKLLNLESEVRLGIIGTIPRRYREETTWFDNRSQSVLIEIGSDQTTGGYQQIRQPLFGNPYYDFVVMSIPWGIRSLTDEVSKAAGDNADNKKFASSASMISREAVRDALRNELEKNPGLMSRKKVYLTGMIVRAMVTLLHPEDRRPFTPITVDDINMFYQRAVNNPQGLLKPDLSRIRANEIREEIEIDLERVRSTFTPKNLIAGAEILKAIASEYTFGGENKRILFPRLSQFSLIISYLRLQAEDWTEP